MEDGALAPKSRRDQRSKQNHYKPREYRRGRGGASGGRGRGRGRGPRLQSNAHRYEESDEDSEHPEGAPTHPEGQESAATSTLAPAKPKHHHRHHETVDDLNTLLNEKFDPTKTNLLDLPEGAVLAQGDDEEDDEYDDDEEYEEDEEYDSEGDEHIPESEKIKIQEFQADEVDELDAFLAETSISSESKRYFKGGASSAAATAKTTSTPQKKADGESTQKWLDSVLI
eukprot:TRINITY_DN13521_c0_g1_i1.p1 TRINITY_DN13521_c0_g1~~TRINITY_DN13521_c0_g1_i1.p1  ORF type:complete len:227 (+),score=46.66 TRINITY_DN13521_c0_g1_i1:44-724(+)